MCIDPWLVEHRTCPMCKLNILKELGVVSSVLLQCISVKGSSTCTGKKSLFTNYMLIKRENFYLVMFLGFKLQPS